MNTFRRAGLIAVVLPLSIQLVLFAQPQTRMVFVNATDAAGAPVLDLTAADFEVREGTDKRTVTSASLSNGPMRIMLVLDTGSSVEPYLGQLRPGLAAFIDAIPAPHEIGIMSIGRQSKARQAPTTDRAKLKDLATKFSLDGGGVAFLDGLRETESRFMKKDNVKWPVYVMFVTDENEASGVMQNEELSRILTDLVGRGTTVHTMYVQKAGPTTATDIAQMLGTNTGGAVEQVTAIQTLPAKLKLIADQIMKDYEVMKTRYQVQYVGDAKYRGSIDAGVIRPGVKAALSLKRG